MKTRNEIEFVGALEELQAFLGVIPRTYEIEEIQYDIHKIMANEDVPVERLDGYIAKLSMPVLEHVHIPTGFTHVCRAVCRRCERIAVRIDSPCIAYLNRLSDYLYILTFNQ